MQFLKVHNTKCSGLKQYKRQLLYNTFITHVLQSFLQTIALYLQQYYMGTFVLDLVFNFSQIDISGLPKIAKSSIMFSFFNKLSNYYNQTTGPKILYQTDKKSLNDH